MNFETVLSTQHKNLALIIGNGINRHQNTDGGRSWWGLLNSLQAMHGNQGDTIPDLLSLTEFYDLLDINKLHDPKSKVSLQKGFSDLMQDWQPGEHHKKIAKWSKSKNVPILTTNFENTLGKAAQCEKVKRIKGTKFTDFYPWSSYYSSKEISDPASAFAIWHINGMQHYYRSIRLGLGHYMGSVARARDWIHGGKENSLFYGKDQNVWRGSQSWIHCIFNNDLLIFGLGLDTQEVFLRWLFIERAKYFKKFPDRKKQAWYVETRDPNKPQEWAAKKFFLEGVGIETIVTETHAEIYTSPEWGRG